MPDTAPPVLVVTPSLNQARFIPETIDSVLTQDYPNIEYLIADGGSTDGTLDLLAGDIRHLNWKTEPDGGQADAVNRAFSNAKAKYLAWLNSDDLYLPGAISAMVHFLEMHPDHALVYGHADNVNAEGRLIGPARQVEPFDAKRLLNDVDFIAQPATLMRRDAFLNVGGLDSSLHWAFDYDLWLKFARNYPIGFIDRVLARMRIHSASKTSVGGLQRLLEIERMARTHGRPSIPNGFAARLAWMRASEAVAAMRHARFREATHQARLAAESFMIYVRFRLHHLPNICHFDTAQR